MCRLLSRSPYFVFVFPSKYFSSYRQVWPLLEWHLVSWPFCLVKIASTRPKQSKWLFSKWKCIRSQLEAKSLIILWRRSEQKFEYLMCLFVKHIAGRNCPHIPANRICTRYAAGIIMPSVEYFCDQLARQTLLWLDCARQLTAVVLFSLNRWKSNNLLWFIQTRKRDFVTLSMSWNGA